MGDQFFGMDGSENFWSSSFQYSDPPQSSSPAVLTGKEVEAVKIGVQQSLSPALVEAMIHGLQAATPQMTCCQHFEELKRMDPTIHPYYPQSSYLPSSSRSLPDHLGNSNASKRFQLHIEGQLPKRLFTGKKLHDHEGFSLEVVLRDESRNIVNVGAESSKKIAVVVLPGDFKAEDNDDLTGRFDKEVLKERQNKPQLLVGECEVALNKGAACIGDFKFTDNSSWTRSGKYRLGVKFAASVSPGVFVREAISDAFVVLERRGEAGQKKKIPSLDDKVECLNGIAPKGIYRNRLNAKGINDVRALLELNDKNPKSLKEILKVTDNKFQVIVNHAALARSNAGVLEVQNTSTAVGINAARVANGNQTGFMEGQGTNSETFLLTGTIDPASYLSSNRQYSDATARILDLPMSSSFSFEELLDFSSEPRSGAAYDSNELGTKFSPKWRRITRAVKWVISLKIIIASRPRKKQKT